MNNIIKKRIISDFNNLPTTINITKKGKRYTKDRHSYCKYMDCTICKNASWYGDDYCNNQKIDFIDEEGIKTTKVYCENFEVEE